MNIVIMAGGGGTRLWPLSRQSSPKQFVDLGTGKPLIVHAYDRAKEVTDENHIFVATNALYGTNIKELLPAVPDSNIFLEPSRRDTTAAFVHVCLQLAKRGLGEEATTFLWSDHLFTNEKEFVGDLRRIPELLEKHPTSLLVIGHTPVNANTALGYFQVGAAVDGAQDVFEVASFKEKPDKDTAELFVAAGSYYWNLGYFSLRPNLLLQEIVRYTPELAAPIKALENAVGSGDNAMVATAFAEFPKMALEYTFVEKMESIIAITGDYGWSDIGNWAVVKEILGVKGDHVPRGHHVHVDSQDNYVYNATDRIVSLVGVTNTVVVVTEDAILVANKDDSHKVKQVVEKIEQEGRKEYL